MAPDESDHPAHLRIILTTELGKALVEDVGDPAAARMTDAFDAQSVGTFPSDAAALLRLEPAAQLVGSHIDDFGEVLRDRALVGRGPQTCGPRTRARICHS